MTNVFTLDAIARCESRGRHLWKFVWSWHDIGCEECEDCGATGPVEARRRDPLVVAPGAPRVTADDATREARNDYIRELRAAGAELLELGEQFGLSIQMVSRICKGVARGDSAPGAIDAVRMKHAVGT